jgi:proline dehydrogenase
MNNSSQQHFDLQNAQRAFAYLSDKQLHRMSRLFKLMGSKALTLIGGKLAKFSLRIGLPIPYYFKNLLYRQFCGGENLEECSNVAQECAQRNILINLHYGIEATDSQESWDHSFNENMKAIAWCAKTKNAISLSVKMTALISLEILQKKQDNQALTSAEEGAYDIFKHRIGQLSVEAKKAGIALYYDAEESWIQEEIDHLVNDLMKLHNKESATVYNTYQMYRRDKLQDFKDTVNKAAVEGYIVGAKLVRGAYVVKEARYAEKHQTPNPLHDNKESVDQDFNEAVHFGIENIHQVAMCIGSHNIKSCERALAKANEDAIELSHPHIVFSQLYGMSDPLSNNLAHYGANVSKYMPYGRAKYLLPYLIRRAEENQSVQGQMSREHQQIHEEILRRRTG